MPKGANYASLSESYIIFVSDFDYFHIGKAVGERVSFLKDTDVSYKDGSHVFFLNSRYAEANASKPILEFLDLVRTNDMEKPYETSLGQQARKRIQEVRSDKALEVSYMTYVQKMMDARRGGYMDGLNERSATIYCAVDNNNPCIFFSLPLKDSQKGKASICEAHCCY